jgi:uncharacterized membrane protein
MNDAHLHLLLNHFPIVGLFFGFGILIVGILKKNKLLLNTAYVIFVFCMIFGKVTMFTGDKAEHMLEENASISHELIHEHEEQAELYMKFLYLLGVTAIIGLYLNFKEHKKWYLMSFIIAIITLTSIIISTQAGTSGGKISHPEIREEC